MTETTNFAPHSLRVRIAAQIGWTLLIVATLCVCYFRHLGAIGFVGPDEPRYAWIARSMVETGDWVTPRLYGKPWFEKPPLYYWGAVLSFKFFGVSEAAARLPSAVSALLATLALAWLACRIYGADTARWLLLLLPTTVGMIGFSHAASTDMPFSAMLTIAMVCAAVVLRLVPAAGYVSLALNSSASLPSLASAQTPWLSLLLFGFFLGAAVLAKGPAAIVLCGGAVFFWALFTKRWREAFRLLHPVAIATFCLTALPWYILCARRNPDFLRTFLIEHNFKRYVTPEFQHLHPFWYYLPILLAALLPWTLGYLAWLSKARPAGEPSSSDTRRTFFFLSFGIFPLLFFSASQSKLPGYILPALPPLACLLATRITGVVRAEIPHKRITCLAFALTLLALAIAGEQFAAHRVLGQSTLPAPWTARVWLPLLAGANVAIILAYLRRYAASLCTVQVGTLLAVIGLSSGLVWMDSQLSARDVIALARTPLESAPSGAVLVHEVSRGTQYGLSFYLRREILQWTPDVKGEVFVFTSWKGEQRLKAAGYSCQQHIVHPAATLCRRQRDDAIALPSP